MNVQEIIADIEVIKNNFLGYQPETGYESDPGPSTEVRIARAVYWLEQLRRKLLDGAAVQPNDAGEAQFGALG